MAAHDASAVDASPERGNALRLRDSDIAWLVVVSTGAVFAAWRFAAGGAGSMPGGMPASAVLFVGDWSLMMAAMMLPATTPVARLYLALGDPAARARERAGSAAGLIGGYLLGWALAGVGALVVARGMARLVDGQPGLSRVAAAATIAACGLYQLSPLKDRCLAHCRSPLGLIAHAGRHRGPLRHLRAGVSHAGWCIGCCWTLMLALVMLGAMQLAWMGAFVVVLVLEKTWRHGRRVAVVAGVALLVLGVAVLIDSSVAGILDTGGMEGM